MYEVQINVLKFIFVFKIKIWPYFKLSSIIKVWRKFLLSTTVLKIVKALFRTKYVEIKKNLVRALVSKKYKMVIKIKMLYYQLYVTMFLNS